MKRAILFFAPIMLFISHVHAHSKDIIEEDRKLSSFIGVEASQGVSVTISVADEQQVTVSADQQIISYVITEVIGDILKISIGDKYKTQKFKEYPVSVNITVPKITSLAANTKSRVTVSSSFYAGDNLTIVATSAASIHFEKEFTVSALNIHANSNAKLIAKGLSKATKAKIATTSNAEVIMDMEVTDEIECSAASKSKITMNGKANKAQLSAMSSSEIRMRGFETQHTNAVAMTAAQIQITVHESLAATAASEALINYWGKPKSINKETTTRGKIK